MAGRGMPRIRLTICWGKDMIALCACRLIIKTVLKMCRYSWSCWRNPSQGLKLLAVHTVLLLVFSYFVGPWAYVLFWLVPYFTVFQVIGWLSEVSEHFAMFGLYQEEVQLTRN